MKYIEEIRLKNFQSHIDTKLELDPKLNIIVGESDSGKTSILRAIKWVLYNEPLGDFFIRQGELEASVTLVFNDKTQVTRYRSASKNQYKLILSDGSEEIYEGFGTGVPEEIIDATGIDKLELDQNESRTINLGEQLEGAFLLSEKDSVKASSIGRLVGVNIIDDALRQSLSDLRGLNQEKNRITKVVDRLESDYEEFDYLIALEDRLNDTKMDFKRIKELNDNREILNELYLKKKNMEIDHKSIKERLKLLENIINVEKYIDKISLYWFKYNNLNKIYNNLNRINIELNRENEKKEKLKHIKEINVLTESLNDNINNYNSINKLYETNSNLNNDIKKITDLLNSIKNIDEVDEYNNDLIELINRYKYLNKLYTKLEDTKKRHDYGVKYISNFEKIDDIDYEKILEYNNKLIILNNIKYKLENLMKIKGKLNMDLVKINNNIKELLILYRDTLAKQDVCPLCLNVIDEEHIEVIINDYMEDMKI